MGLVVKKDDLQNEEDRDVEIVERGTGPDPSAENPVELIGRANDPAADAEAAHRAELEEEARQNRATSERLAEEAQHERLSDEGEDDEGSSASEDADGGAFGKKGAGVRLPFAVAAVVIAAVVFGIGGFFIGSGGFGGKGIGTAALSEDQLDDVVATYTYNGARHDVTARQAIETQYSVDTVKDEDGTYAAPSAETVVAYVRQQILVNEAEARGIEVSDDDMDSYAEATLGSSDYDALSQQYGVTADQAKDIVRVNCLQEKLYEQVVPNGQATAPTAPTEPADGNNDTVTKEYADYIIGLLGDEWDSQANTWARTDGPFYEALGQEDWSADGASYTQAQTAYYVAYQQYAEQANEGQSTWRDFVNGLYQNANVDIFGLYV